ncbi:MAG TPA: T9SS type A sorting domain-containing protein [Flavobacteriales bacterium]|nr:T9SS type A sorting domain-containing protein [Flavobacteriales bacterium]
MRKLYIITLFLALIGPVIPIQLLAGPGDTTVIQAFTFGGTQDDIIVFPPDSISYEKILMYYTLKCNPAQNPACGEWDYTTHTFLYEDLGTFDSTQMFQPSYVMDGQSPDTLTYMNSPSWSYVTWWEKFIVYSSTLSFDSAVVGSGATSSSAPFTSAVSDASSQYLWTAAELSAAGATAGDISGIRFDLSTVGSELKHLTIRLKHSSKSELIASDYEIGGFTEVYARNTDFTAVGWNTLSFTTPFNWNGTSNLVVEISFNNDGGGTSNSVLSHVPSFNAGVHSSSTEYSLNFNGPDFVDVPGSALSSLTNDITISLWQYGDPNIQPQSDYIFEAYDTNGYRVLNCHLPWGNGSVYWDAGNDIGSVDRISKAANETDYKGQWNHWAFTKDAGSGQMRIYLNGAFWNIGSAKNRDMTGITLFKIGSNAPGTNSYDGYVDEFRVWNAYLDQATIADWMYKDVDPSHPNYSNLLAYYKFNEGTGLTTADASGNGNSGSLFGAPGWKNGDGTKLMRNYQSVSERPNVIFEQGVYTSSIDSMLIEDSVMQDPVTLVTYADGPDPTIAIDTQYVWHSYYNNYTYDINGNATDSTLVSPDVTSYLQQFEYYDVFEEIERFEIGRFITPYGNGLSLGDGWLWIYDVSDYRTLLADSVRLTAGNWQEMLDLKFLMIEGVPPRNVIKVENLWKGNFYLNSIDSTVADWSVQLDPTASMYKLKTRASGHLFSNPTNCAEFCYKIHNVDVDATLVYSWEIMQQCGMNPLYPQGGTWVYDRAGWCPGMEVEEQNVELTNFVTPGTIVDIDYDSQTDPDGYYILRAHLVSYGSPNFTLDAAVEEIISPNNWEIQNRFNPICDNPVIVIKNTGSTPLTSLDIDFGVKGGVVNTYQWTGSLEFLETELVSLSAADDCWFINGNAESNIFEVRVKNPNGGSDEYTPNNYFKSNFDVPVAYANPIYLLFRTNNVPNESSWLVEDDKGNTVYQSGGLMANTMYADTFNLSPGCYRLIVNDSDCDGLSWWANSDGAGFARLYKGDGSNTQLVNFEPDFGCQIAQSFTIADPVYTVSTTNASCGNSDGTASITVSDATAAYTFNWSNGANTSSITNVSAGIYTVTVTNGSGCNYVDNAVIDDAGAPSITLISSSDVACNGACDGQVVVIAVGGGGQYTYLWSDGQTAATASGLCPGDYNVTVTDNLGCSAFAMYSITEPVVLTSNVFAVDEVMGCDGSAFVNTSGGMMPYSFLWDDPAAQSNYMATNICGGTYNVVVTDANGCTTTSSAFIVTGVQEIPETASMQLYPNPNSGSFKIWSFIPGAVDFEISVIDLLGRTVQRKMYGSRNGILSTDIVLQSDPGIYFVRLRTGKYNVLEKIVIQ